MIAIRSFCYRCHVDIAYVDHKLIIIVVIVTTVSYESRPDFEANNMALEKTSLISLSSHSNWFPLCASLTACINAGCMKLFGRKTGESIHLFCTS